MLYHDLIQTAHSHAHIPFIQEPTAWEGVCTHPGSCEQVTSVFFHLSCPSYTNFNKMDFRRPPLVKD